MTNDDVIAANRSRRERANRRKLAISIANLLALATALVVDGILDLQPERGVAPFALIAAGGMNFGHVWLQARRQDGVERLIVGRAAMIAMAITLAYCVGTYAVYLVDRSIGIAPGRYVMVAGVALMIGTLFGDHGIGEANE